jgi:glycosyltransferase involved in cell wall biosynthesis
MTFSIITPSFRNSQWLRLCIASVADQQGVKAEHIVQDSCSDDGTGDWLPEDKRVKAFIEKDRGMYDAVNRGFARAGGDILAYLNCDEQYLPGALKAVEECFERHPETEVVLADTLVTDRNGDYVCHRCSLIPRKHQMWVRFPVLTCSVFLRASVVRERRILFDTQWRDFGDWWWVRSMVLGGVRMRLLPRFVAAFADTGENMNLKPNAARERAEKQRLTPWWVWRLEKPFILNYRLQLLLRPPLLVRPFDYTLYTLASPQQRVLRHVDRPTSIWKGRG